MTTLPKPKLKANKNLISPHFSTMYKSPYASPLIKSGHQTRTPSLQRIQSDPGISTPKFPKITLNEAKNQEKIQLLNNNNNNDILQPLQPQHRVMTVPINLSDYHHPSIVLELLLNLPMECHIGIGDNLKSMIKQAIDEQTQLEKQELNNNNNTDIFFNKDNIAPAPIDIPPTAPTAPTAPTPLARNSFIDENYNNFNDNNDIVSPIKRKPSIKQFESVLQERYTSTLMIAIAQVLIGAFLSGYNTSILNVPSYIIISECNLNLTTYSSLQSIYCFGGLIGALSIGRIADRFGRKPCIIMYEIIYIISGILNILYGYKFFGSFNNSTFILFIISRCLCGVAAGISSGIIPTYLGEISPPLIRGTIGTLYQLTVCFGLISSEILGYNRIFGNVSLWPALFILNILLPFIQLLSLKKLPESPKWLMNNNDEIEARKIFCYLRKCSNVDMDIYFVKTVNEYQENMKHARTLSIHTLSSVTDIIHNKTVNNNYGSIKPAQSQKQIQEAEKVKETNRILFWSYCIAIALQIMQQFSGINSVFYYSNTTLINAGFETPIKLWFGNILIAFANFVSVWIPVNCMDRLGRKALLNISLIGMVIASVGFSIALLIKHDNDNDNNDPNIDRITGYASLIFLIFYVVSFEIGLGPIPWLMMAEIAPSSHRASIVSWATFVNWASNLIIAQFAAEIVLYLQFFPFALVCLVGILFTYYVIPETKGKTEAQIQKELLH